MRAPTDAGPRAHPATPRNRGRRDAQPSQEGEPTGVPEAEAPAWAGSIARHRSNRRSFGFQRQSRKRRSTSGWEPSSSGRHGTQSPPDRLSKKPQASTTVLVKLSGGDVTSGTIHLFALLLDRKGTGEFERVFPIAVAPKSGEGGVKNR